ncbi:MAG: hypothetical protein JXB62_19120 [Pirellulales bacterium]|nr:hypothetical protein [Pirellulales bacterium]
MRWTVETLLSAALLAGVTLAGCGENDPFDPNKPRRNVADGVAGLAPVEMQTDNGMGGKAPPPPPPATADGNSQADKQGVPPPPPPPPPSKTQEPGGAKPAAAPADQGERREAVVGDNVGRKGRGYGGGIITQPISTYFTVKDRIVMLQVEDSLKMFKAEHGRGPKSHEEFMEKVIEANSIRLPELFRQDDRYVYDPEKGVLMVESAQ